MSGKLENERPGEAVAEFGTDLAMGPDTAGFVVRRPVINRAPTRA